MRMIWILVTADESRAFHPLRYKVCVDTEENEINNNKNRDEDVDTEIHN